MQTGGMTDRGVFYKNWILGTEFSRSRTPKFADKISENALVVLLPEYDQELCKANMELAKKNREKGQPILYVRIEKLKPIKSRLVNPKLELQES